MSLWTRSGPHPTRVPVLFSTRYLLPTTLFFHSAFPIPHFALLIFARLTGGKSVASAAAAVAAGTDQVGDYVDRYLGIDGGPGGIVADARHGASIVQPRRLPAGESLQNRFQSEEMLKVQEFFDIWGGANSAEIISVEGQKLGHLPAPNAIQEKRFRPDGAAASALEQPIRLQAVIAVDDDAHELGDIIAGHGQRPRFVS